MVVHNDYFFHTDQPLTIVQYNVIMDSMEAEKGTPKLHQTCSEVSPNTVLPRFAEVISEASPNSLRSFAEVTSEASPMLRRTQLRYLLYHKNRNGTLYKTGM